MVNVYLYPLVLGKCVRVCACVSFHFYYSLLFEATDLSDASPATISRTGMVFMGSALGYQPIVEVCIDS